MLKLAEVALAAVASFAATNLDDIIVLMVFFAQANNPNSNSPSNFKRRHIIIGQYLGFFTIILASLPGFFGGLIIDKKMIGILGVIPIFIGIQQLINNLQNQNWQNNNLPNNSDEIEIQEVSAEINNVTESTKLGDRSFISLLASIISPQTYKVATVTFANGGDNIGIYVPLFASSNITSLAIILSIFFVMIGIWIYVAFWLSQHRAIAQIITSRGHQLVPFILIGLGIFILVDSQTYKLLFSRQ